MTNKTLDMYRLYQAITYIKQAESDDAALQLVSRNAETLCVSCWSTRGERLEVIRQIRSWGYDRLGVDMTLLLAAGLVE